MSRLSKTQHNRLAGLLNIMQGREPVNEIKNDLINRGLAYKDGATVQLTPDGKNEADRLQILAGLMVANEYVQHRQSQVVSRKPSTPNRPSQLGERNTPQNQPSDHTKSISVYSIKKS